MGYEHAVDFIIENLSYINIGLVIYKERHLNV